ncbi:hypothetical protein E6W39_15930 [Kitasatospora acidiphila]|uniref:Uncharacterized protein n=1 Tax=Kitasatospora acidiphila TaxID=2567942 RepID=A0A540W354_9ACTN|nr:hypothetical protein [Kitasatospora acidiphila]TQF03450.1 hypothetical protein E6W39_15930 [Kitasatospora acidiphila]
MADGDGEFSGGSWATGELVDGSATAAPPAGSAAGVLGAAEVAEVADGWPLFTVLAGAPDRCAPEPPVSPVNAAALGVSMLTPVMAPSSTRASTATRTTGRNLRTRAVPRWCSLVIRT